MNIYIYDEDPQYLDMMNRQLVEAGHKVLGSNNSSMASLGLITDKETLSMAIITVEELNRDDALVLIGQCVEWKIPVMVRTSRRLQEEHVESEIALIEKDLGRTVKRSEVEYYVLDGDNRNDLLDLLVADVREFASERHIKDKLKG